MNLSESAAYLKGLADGMGLNENEPKDKLILKLLDLVNDMAETVENLEQQCDDLRDYADELDSDLGDVEEYLFCDDEDDDDEDYEEDFDDEDLYEVTYPSCGEVICFDDTCDVEQLVCPACGEEFDCTEECDGDCAACAEDCDEKGE